MSKKYKYVMLYPDGTREEDDEVFDTYDEAYAAGEYGIACYSEGADILNMSNPGDYPLKDDEADFEVVEVTD